MEEYRSLYRNLQALEDASFPKRCEKCDMVYENEAEYIQKSLPYQKTSGLIEAEDNGKNFIKLIRVCPCGEPILDHFGDRRDNSKQGEIRRRAFEKVIIELVNKGIQRSVARKELLKHMRGQKSFLLTEMGIFTQKNSA